MPNNTISKNAFLVFDLETQREIAKVGGRENINRLKMSVAAVWDATTNKEEIYYEQDAPALIEKLTSGLPVIGFNHVFFDYTVLSAYLPDPTLGADYFTQYPHFDILLDLQKRLGHRLSLDSLVGPTLHEKKTADGLQALRWYEQYQATQDESLIQKIAEYCCQDVRITRDLYLYGYKHNKVFYNSKRDVLQAVEVDWSKFQILPKRLNNTEQPTNEQTSLF